ncbi:hypothetical protein PINS_up021857 [Pythium insidiosum]|nr:hypothetical protein PINS_up016462 [Pythium insidiosum]GLE09918.1 hypothetical protein PINS_up021857 [Pythium insidiosum]
MKIQQREQKQAPTTTPTFGAAADSVPQPEAEAETTHTVETQCRIGGCKNPVVAPHETSALCAEHRAQLLVAASLLGMQAAN